MMNNSPISKTIANKYAKAFMAVFPKSLTFADIGKMKIAQKFLQTQKQILLFLQLPQFDHERKKSMIADLISHFSLPQHLSAIILLLITHNRSFYIPTVFLSIIKLYQEETHSVEFSIKSTQNLDDRQTETIKQFLSKLLDKNITGSVSIDDSLIAGLRLQSDDYLWEYSVRKHIQTLQKLER